MTNEGYKHKKILLAPLAALLICFISHIHNGAAAYNCDG